MRFRYSQCLLAAFSFVCFQSCQSKDDAEQAETISYATASTTTVTSAQALAKHFGPIIRGAWVNANYLALLQQTKSPLIAYDSTGYISEIIINPTAISGDSLVAGVGYGNHEGGDLTIYFRAGQQTNTLSTNHHEYESPGSYAELGYRLSASDTMLVLNTFNKQKQLIAHATYRRIRNGKLDQLDNLTLAANQLLMAGNYVGVDSLQRPTHLQFTADRRVIGWSSIKTYEVNTDFGAGPGNEIDHLIVKGSNKLDRVIHFQFRADTLRLYNAAMVVTKQHAGTDDEIVDERLTRGKLLFTLVRR
jgi:hypothetical protein